MQRSDGTTDQRPLTIKIGPEDLVIMKLPLEEAVSVALAQQPWSSAGDLARRLEVPESEVHGACRELEERMLIAGSDVGVTRRKRRRYVLSRLGVQHVTKDFRYGDLLRTALPLTWQMSEEGARRLQLWMPMVESVNELLPTFWTSGLSEPLRLESMYADPAYTDRLWLGEPTLSDVLWLPRGRIHVVASWRFDRADLQQSQHVSIPFLWSGLLPQKGFQGRSLQAESPFIRSDWNPGFYVQWDVAPTVIAIGADLFAAFRGQTAYGGDVSVGAADTSGVLVHRAAPSHTAWILTDTPRARTIGQPENTGSEAAELLTLGGTGEYRVICFLAQCRAATKADLAEAFRMSRGRVTTMLQHLTERDLVTNVGANLYLTRRGVEMLAALHRVDAGRLVEVTHDDPEGEAASRERRHDAGVAQVAAAFLKAGMPVAAGWRWEVSWEAGLLVPDLWVQLSAPGREDAVWVPVELEFSAVGARRIGKKLRSYKLAPGDIRRTFPALVITGKALAAERFMELAGDLPLLATTLPEFLTGVWEGPDSVWRRQGETAGLNDLARTPWDHLCQSTGLALDFSAPPDGIWDRYLREETRAEDPHGPVIDDLSPADLHTEAGFEPALAEITDEPAPAQPATPAAPATPPTPLAPAPVRAMNSDQLKLRLMFYLDRIHPLIERAYTSAGKILEVPGLSGAERLCLQRVRATILYGAALEDLPPTDLVERLLSIQDLLSQCISLRDQHHAVDSAGILRRIWTGPPTNTDPRETLRHLLRNYGRDDGVETACAVFDDWFERVERHARSSR